MRQVIGYSRTALQRPVHLFTSRIAFVVLAFLFSCLSPAQADPLRVHVLLSDRGGAYQEFSDALRVELKTRSFVLSFGEPEEMATDTDLIIAVGMKSANAVLASNKHVLNVLVPREGYDKLSRHTPEHQSSAIYLDQPIERQLSLLHAALPKFKRIGVLYTTPPIGLAKLRRLVAEKDMLLIEKIVGQEHPLHDALNELLEESEVLLVLPDTEVYNAGTIRNILLSSYRKHVPLIGISQPYVKAGALCAIYSTPMQIAVQAADAVEQFASSGKLPPSQYPREFEVSINMQVARSLDLPVKDPEKLRNEVKGAP